MKKTKTMLAVLSAAVTCVSASVLPLSNCFAAETVTVSATSETVPDKSAETNTEPSVIADTLRKYVAEAKIPAGIRSNCCGHVTIHYKCENKDVPDKINAFVEENNIYKKGITYVVDRTSLGDPTGKITDLDIISDMLNRYVRKNNIPARICDGSYAGEPEITTPYSQLPFVEVSYRKADEAYEGEIKEKIEKFIAENNIYEYSTIYYVNSMSVFWAIDLLEDYIKEAKIPVALYQGYDETSSSFTSSSFINITYDSSDEAYEGEIKDKIKAFVDENNILEHEISYFDTKNVPETTNGKITAPYIIWDMMAQFAKDNGIKVNMRWYKKCAYHGDYIDFELQDNTLSISEEYDMYDKIVDFITDNNIKRDMVLISNLTARPPITNDKKFQYAGSEPSNITGSTPIATGSDLEKTAKWGDVNTDGAVDISDVVKLNMYLLDKTACPLSEQGLVNANCAYDDVIDAADAVIINNYVCMMIDYSELGPKK